MSNIASAHYQRYTKASVFWLAQMTLYVMSLRHFRPFVGKMSFQIVRQTGCQYVNHKPVGRHWSPSRSPWELPYWWSSQSRSCGPCVRRGRSHPSLLATSWLRGWAGTCSRRGWSTASSHWSHWIAGINNVSKYCEIIFIHWTFNFVYFVGSTIHNLRSQQNIYSF